MMAWASALSAWGWVQTQDWRNLGSSSRPSLRTVQLIGMEGKYHTKWCGKKGPRFVWTDRGKHVLAWMLCIDLHVHAVCSSCPNEGQVKWNEKAEQKNQINSCTYLWILIEIYCVCSFSWKKRGNAAQMFTAAEVNICDLLSLSCWFLPTTALSYACKIHLPVDSIRWHQLTPRWAWFEWFQTAHL